MIITHNKKNKTYEVINDGGQICHHIAEDVVYKLCQFVEHEDNVANCRTEFPEASEENLPKIVAIFEKELEKGADYNEVVSETGFRARKEGLLPALD